MKMQSSSPTPSQSSLAYISPENMDQSQYGPYYNCFRPNYVSEMTLTDSIITTTYEFYPTTTTNELDANQYQPSSNLMIPSKWEEEYFYGNTFQHLPGFTEGFVGGGGGGGGGFEYAYSQNFTCQPTIAAAANTSLANMATQPNVQMFNEQQVCIDEFASVGIKIEDSEQDNVMSNSTITTINVEYSPVSMHVSPSSQATTNSDSSNCTETSLKCHNNSSSGGSKQQPVTTTTKPFRKIFPYRLYELASDANFEPLSWNESGDKLVINLHSLQPQLEKICKSTKFSSFLRQLHLYGFRKDLRQSSNRKPFATAALYSHRNGYFHRDEPHLLSQIVRVKLV